MFNKFRNQRHSGNKIDDLLSAYIDGALTSDEQTALEARLKREPALQERLQGLRLTVNALTDLPEVETPRNFILSPAMVAAPRPAAAPRRRSTWPILGWATTVATLLLLVVLAGDLFVIAPSLREEHPSQPMMLGAEAAPTSDAQMVVELVVEKETVAEAVPVEIPAAEQEPAAEVEAPAPEETPRAMLVEPPQAEEMAPTATAATENAGAPPPSAPEPTALSTAAPPSAEVEVTAQEETPLARLGEHPQAEDMVPTIEAETADAGYLQSPTSEPDAPPAGEGKTRNDESFAATQQATPTPVPMVNISAPLTQTDSDLDAKDSDKSVRLWLRGAEIGLGLLVAGLAVATLIARRRSR